MNSIDQSSARVETQRLLDRLQPRLKVEEYFNLSGRTFRKSRFRLWFNRNIKTFILRTMFKAAGIYRRGRRNALQPVVKRIDLRFPKLPEGLRGFEILHLSDFHIDQVDGLAEALVKLLRSLRPDLCVLTGDYRWEISGPCDEVYARMYRVFDSIEARHGIVATLGNHDAAEMALKFEERGVCMLVNDSTVIEHEGEELWIGGLDDSFDYRCADLDLALTDVPANGFKVLLAHTPELFEDAASRGIQLYLCGHTHAGQVRLPLLGAVKKNARVPRRLVQGHWRQNGMQGYTSWGAGCSTLPVRYNCPPEILLLRLLPEET